MVRYLSPAWLDRLEAPVAGRGSGPSVVLRQVVTATPEGGDAGYDVVIAGGAHQLHRQGALVADITFTSDYPTASAIAAGSTSVSEALAAGRVKVTGDVSLLRRLAGELAGVEAMPEGLRAETEFG